MEYAVMAQTSHLDICLKLFDLEIAAQYISWRHINLLPCVIGNNIKSTKIHIFNQRNKRNHQEFIWKWHIHLSGSPDLRYAQNNHVEDFHSENRVQSKVRWTQTKDFKAVGWFGQLYYQQNYNWPIMTIKKGNFP